METLTPRPISIAIAALGGQGGGVLAEWIVAAAEAEGYLAQYTSVQGVAQRTGTTIYYLELFPRAAAVQAGREPVLALMPVPGDVDIVIAAELMEAGRAITRGIVTPDRTTLIASTHRIFAVNEKAAMADGRADPLPVMTAAAAAARQLIAFDMDAVARSHGSIISAALFGALCGSGATPLSETACEAAIRAGGISVAPSLAAFSEARRRAEQQAEATDGLTRACAKHPAHTESSARTVSAEAVRSSHALRQRIDERLPASVRAFTHEGLARAAEYQDRDYAARYLDRVERMYRLDEQFAGAAYDFAFTREIARHLALWMCYQDVIRVADLKTRSARFMRFRTDVNAAPDQIVQVSEYVHPRLEEVLDILPASLAARIASSRALQRMLHPLFRKGRRITTTNVSGFLVFHLLAMLRPVRRTSRRFAEETARIEAWLDQAAHAIAVSPALGLELARLPRLLKGYGDTWARGRRNFETVCGWAARLSHAPDAASLIARLAESALADEDGRALAAAIRQIEQKSPTPSPIDATSETAR